MAAQIDPRRIERAEKALARAGFRVESTQTSAKGETVTFKVKVAQ